MQKMGQAPGGPGPMEPMPPGAPGPGAMDPQQSMRGGPGPMDPPIADTLGATMEGGRDAGGEGGGLLPPPRSDSERFFEDLKVFVADTEQLLRQARTLSGEGALAAREEFERRLAQAREGFDTAREAAMEHVYDWRDRTEAYVRRDPWKAVGIAAGVGFLLGMLTGRGDDE